MLKRNAFRPACSAALYGCMAEAAMPLFKSAASRNLPCWLLERGGIAAQCGTRQPFRVHKESRRQTPAALLFNIVRCSDQLSQDCRDHLGAREQSAGNFFS